MTDTNRREVLKVLGISAGFAGALSAEDLSMAEAAHRHHEAQEAKPAGPFRAQFFQGREHATVSRLTDLILPSDGTPGAKDAGVAEFLDFYLAGSTATTQKEF